MLHADADADAGESVWEVTDWLAPSLQLGVPCPHTRMLGVSPPLFLSLNTLFWPVIVLKNHWHVVIFTC